MLVIKGRPQRLHGVVRLPASKSYLHRALFVASLADGFSKILDSGKTFSDDIEATIRVLKSLDVKITKSQKANGSISVTPGWTSKKRVSVYVKGSGTTARFAAAFAALAPESVETRLSGDSSLSKRPMQEVLEALRSLGVDCYSEKGTGNLPIVVKGGGIRGGFCKLDGSVSSQFISSLLISCTRARKDTIIQIKNPSRLVSRPYIDATLKVLEHFGFDVEVTPSKGSEYSRFEIRANQRGKAMAFRVPGDMSAASALIGAAISAKGDLKLLGVDQNLPQSDAIFLSFAHLFGGRITHGKNSVRVRSRQISSKPIDLDLKDAPDLVPSVAGLAAGLGRDLLISNVGHLRFKESNRLLALASGLDKLGVRTRITDTSLSIFGAGKSTSGLRKPILLDPQQDHRMLMAFTIAGLSGRFGEVLVSDPDCVAKSYHHFIKDIQRLCGEKNTVRLIRS